MTRAKHSLHLISNHNQFDLSEKVPMSIKEDNQVYSEPNLQTVLMSLKNINLGFTSSIELNGDDIIAGTKVTLKEQYYDKPRLLVQGKNSIAQLSKNFETEITQYENLGYQIVDIEIETVIHWEDKKNNISKKHPLCKFVIKK